MVFLHIAASQNWMWKGWSQRKEGGTSQNIMEVLKRFFCIK